MEFNYVSLFSGIGGFEQALNKLGGNCVMASEIDKFANQAYEVLYGHKTVGDITKVDAKDVPDHDVLVGGFPCQAFSVAGKRLGFDDTRGTLFFEIARLAAEKKPKLMLLENVKGLISHDKGKTLDTIVQTLNDIGYTVDFDVLNSKYFGVPQNRERIFIVAVRDDLIEVSPWVTGKRTDVVAKGKKRISALAGVKTFNFDWPTQERVDVRLRDILEPEVDEKYYLSEEKTEALVAKLRDREIEALELRAPNDVNAINSPEVVTKNQNGTRIKPNDEPMSALTVQDRHGVIEGLPIREATTKGYAVAAEGDAVNFQFPNSKTRRGRVGKQIAQTLEASSINQGVVEATVINYSRKEGIGKERDVALCLSSSDWRGLNRNQQQNAVLETSPQYRIRKLTPLECWRLQGFSDKAHETVKSAGVSDSQRYKMAGNAVTVNVIEAIGRKLIPLLNESEAK